MAWEQKDTDQLLHDISKLREQCRQHEWQPIEAAPKQERPFLVFSPTLGYGTRSWLPNSEEWMDSMHYSYVDECDSCTHWMPLPAAPMNPVHPTKEEV